MAKRIGRTKTELYVFDKDNNKVYVMSKFKMITETWKSFDWDTYKTNKLTTKVNKEKLIARLLKDKENRKPVPQGCWNTYTRDKNFCNWIDEVLKDL